MIEIVKSYLRIDFNSHYSFKHITAPELYKVIDRIERTESIDIYNELSLNLFYKNMLSVKK